MANLVCPECKATIFTPSNDTDYHKRLLDGHNKAVHGDPMARATKLLSKCVSTLHLVEANGGVRGFSRVETRNLINELGDFLKIPREAGPPSGGVVAVPAPPPESVPTIKQEQSTSLMNNNPSTPEMTARANRKETNEALK